MRRLIVITLLLLAACVGAFLLRRRLRPRPAVATPAAPMQQEPVTMLWAWETPEDLRTLDPTRIGVAFLARELLLNDGLTVRPRHQPLRVAPATWLMAVVRIETGPHFVPAKMNVWQVAAEIVAAAQQPGVRAVQVDFDAALSERDIYAALLREVRRNLPTGMPLSMTALVSWCGPHSWLHQLSGLRTPAVDEAVPMFFRMGGPSATRAAAPRSTSSIAEPLCATSLGLATDEAWPAPQPNAPTQRVYLFRPGPWTKEDIAKLNALGYESLRR